MHEEDGAAPRGEDVGSAVERPHLETGAKAVRISRGAGEALGEGVVTANGVQDAGADGLRGGAITAVNHELQSPRTSPR